jgi:hypothetical protein
MPFAQMHCPSLQHITALILTKPHCHRSRSQHTRALSGTSWRSLYTCFLHLRREGMTDHSMHRVPPLCCPLPGMTPTVSDWCHASRRSALMGLSQWAHGASVPLGGSSRW